MSEKTFMQQVGAIQASADDGTRRRYWEILSDDQPDEQQAEELSRLAFKLDKRFSDIEADRAIAVEVKSLRGAVKNGRDLRSEIARRDAMVNENAKKRAEAIRKLDGEHQELVNARDELDARLKAGEAACRRLDELKRNNPALLLDVEVPDPASL